MRFIKILYSSFKNTPNIYKSLMGNDVISNVTNNSRSELHKNNWTISKGFYLLTDMIIPTLPIHCPSWMPNIVKKTIFGGNSVYIEDKNYCNKNSEYFLFINGILTNETILEQTLNLLRNKFNRPINCVFNKTDSLIMDLFEATIGKTTNDLTEVSHLVLSTVSKILLDENIDKLVIICHSQGTIIMSQVLQNLEKFGLDKEDLLKKMEIYAFANCSTQMKYVVKDYPYMEHFANENDIIAKMGCNYSPDIKDYIDIDGKIYIKENGYGHLFNSHYLENFTNDYPLSNLNKYLK